MIGKKLNQRYVITGELGAGAMGMVYRAHDDRTDAEVAVKVLPPALARNPQYLMRFEREARALRELNHPNIVPFIDSFEEEGNHYLVMAFMAGGSLHSRLQRAALPADEARHIAIDLCDALIRAHKLGIVHRDIKPDNVLFDEKGVPRLADLGVAGVEMQGERLTGTGTQIGTPYYMSPEAWQGLPQDSQSDIWSLGIVIYEMLTGDVPFKGSTTIQVMRSVLEDPTPNLQVFRPDVPHGLSQIVHKMLAKDRRERYQSMREVSADLERGSPSHPLPEGVKTAFIEPQRPAKKRQSFNWLWLGAAAVLIAAVIGAIILLGGRDDDKATPEATDESVAQIEQTPSEAILPSATNTQTTDSIENTPPPITNTDEPTATNTPEPTHTLAPTLSPNPRAEIEALVNPDQTVQVSGRLINSFDEPLPNVPVNILMRPTAGHGFYTEYTISGVVPNNATHAILGYFVNDDTRTTGAADFSLYEVRYTTNDDPTNLIPNANFQSGLNLWHPLTGNQFATPVILPSDRGAGNMLDVVVPAGNQSGLLSETIEVTPGANYTATFAARVSLDSTDHGLFVVLWLGTNDQEFDRERLYFGAQETHLLQTTTDEQGNFNVTLDSLPSGEFRIITRFAPPDPYNLIARSQAVTIDKSTHLDLTAEATSTRNITVRGTLSSLNGVVAHAPIEISLLPLEGRGIETTYTLSGTVPEGSTSARVGYRSNTECDNCRGVTDFILLGMAYQQGDDPTNLVPPRAGNAEWDTWGDDVIQVVPRGGALHILSPSRAAGMNSPSFDVTPGSNFTATFTVQMAPRSNNTGYFTVIFIERRESFRYILPFDLVPVPLATATTDANGAFEVALDDLPPGIYQVIVRYLGDESHDPVTSETEVSTQGQRLAVAAITASNSSATGATPPENALDNDLEKQWSAGEDAPQWIELDFGQSVTITLIRLYVRMFPNGRTTGQVQFLTENRDNLQTQRFSAGLRDLERIEYVLGTPLTNIRYIRIYTTQSPSWPAWGEIEAYGTP